VRCPFKNFILKIQDGGPFLRYCNLPIFKTAAVRHLGILKLKFSTANHFRDTYRSALSRKISCWSKFVACTISSRIAQERITWTCCFVACFKAAETTTAQSPWSLRSSLFLHRDFPPPTLTSFGTKVGRVLTGHPVRRRCQSIKSLSLFVCCRQSSSVSFTCISPASCYCVASAAARYVYLYYITFKRDRMWDGSVAEWLACWTQAQKGPGSNRSRDAVG